jgi:hypothetical protein
MHSAIKVTFPHRENPSGGYDSICTVCFVIVGTNTDEPKLRQIELTHRCDPLLAYQVFKSRFPRSSILGAK